MGGEGRQSLVGREVVEVRQRLGSILSVLFDDLGYPKTMCFVSKHEQFWMIKWGRPF